jgi:hypothetical protein
VLLVFGAPVDAIGGALREKLAMNAAPVSDPHAEP